MESVSIGKRQLVLQQVPRTNQPFLYAIFFSFLPEIRKAYSCKCKKELEKNSIFVVAIELDDDSSLVALMRGSSSFLVTSCCE